MMGTQEQFHKLHLNRSKRLYKYTFQLFRMIHENSMSPESAIQGTAGEGPGGKTQLNMDKVREGWKRSSNTALLFSVHSGATSAAIFTLGNCAHPSPRPAGLDVTLGSRGAVPGQCHPWGSATRGAEPPSGKCHRWGRATHEAVPG